MNTDVSICIVNWNTRALLAQCLRSIQTKTHGLVVETIVVDNHSADGSAAMVSAEFPWVRLMALQENLGFARGSNVAAAQALGRHVLYLNPDTALVTNAIAGMAEFLNTHPGHGAVGCRLLNTDGSIQYTCASAFPSPRNELTSMLGLNRLFPRCAWLSARELNHWDHATSCDVECLSGACLMVPRTLVQSLNGFDEHLFIYGEDLDLCCRVRRTGRSLHYLASEVIFHHEGASTQKKGRSFAPLRQRAANMYFLRKNFGIVRALSYRAAVMVGATCRVMGGIATLPWWLARRRTDEWSAFVGRHTELLLWSLGLVRGGSR
jgi:N-acetylglucosaminyl-diphospho-decaprenol L-rhamnosyltransferase